MISVNNSKADTALHAHLASRDDPHDAIVPAMAGAFLALAFSLAVGPPLLISADQSGKRAGISEPAQIGQKVGELRGSARAVAFFWTNAARRRYRVSLRGITHDPP
jgi:hypothetical protein